MENISLPETTSLWNRFIKVRRALYIALTEKSIPDVNRDITTFSWNGYDSGIHDHNGSLKGTIHDIELNLEIEGTTVDNQPKFETDPEGDWNTVPDIRLSGIFVSADGRDGFLDIYFKNGKTDYEAYWLTYKKTHYQLEQVVNQDGQVFDAKMLPIDRRNQITIPGTNVSLNRILRKEDNPIV